jgi:hypothetical protein
LLIHAVRFRLETAYGDYRVIKKSSAIKPCPTSIIIGSSENSASTNAGRKPVKDCVGQRFVGIGRPGTAMIRSANPLKPSSSMLERCVFKWPAETAGLHVNFPASLRVVPNDGLHHP